MVIKGQFLERMTTFQSAGFQLEGLFHENDLPTGCVIASPHPVFGGSMDSPVCSELAWAITRRKTPSLRFNYRGVGASHGKGHQTRPDARDELDDLHAACLWMQSTAKGERVHLAGYSFGAWLASHLVLRPGRVVEKLALVAPPTREMPFDFAALSETGIPTLIVVPRADRHADVEALSQLEKLPNLTIELIPDADHQFMRGLAVAGRLVGDFLVGPEPGRLVELPESPDPPLELDDGKS